MFYKNYALVFNNFSKSDKIPTSTKTIKTHFFYLFSLLLLSVFVYPLNSFSQTLCQGDFNNDGAVDTADFAVFFADWGRTDCSQETPCQSDLNSDGNVDTADFAVFFADWGRTDCPADEDGDGYTLSDGDCDDSNSTVFPGADEICGDGIDQNCSGADQPCNTGPHGALLYQDYPDNCLSCHEIEANDMFGSTHYQWVGEAPDMVNAVDVPQGKLINAVNSYCINILGDWKVCGSCHIGRGERPDTPGVGVENIDCLACHNEEYALARVRLADGTMGVVTPTNSMVQNVQAPTRVNCTKCHSTAGGGDGVKRGDLSLALVTNADPNFDVHMNTTGSDLACQACHVFQNHKVLGKGSDIRPTDDLTRGAEVKCVTCHVGKDQAGGHVTAKVNDHVDSVACQTCHVPTYAKVATEIHRDWQTHHDGSLADGVSGPGHPHTEKSANLIPTYKFWNRLSDNYLLNDDASNTYDPVTGTYPTSRPQGDIFDVNSKIYPFKYKTATQPKTVDDDRLIALDTFEYLKGSGNVVTAIENGLVNMGYPASESYEWVVTDTYQLLNHGVDPAINALTCADCHSGSSGLSTDTRMPFSELGYHDFRNSSIDLCALCHDSESADRAGVHDIHVGNEGFDCNSCHGTGAPLKKPQNDLCNDCHEYKNDSIQKIHKKHVVSKNYDCSACHTY